jgi:hypothetical protein
MDIGNIEEANKVLIIYDTMFSENIGTQIAYSLQNDLIDIL